MKLKDFTQQLDQEWVNDFSKTHSPKTVKNAHGLLSAVLKVFSPGISLQPTIPKKAKNILTIPDDAAIEILVDYLGDHDADMLRAVYLAAFGTLRRSEICALTAADISGNIVHICKTMVKDSENKFIVQNRTKTLSSDRYVELPHFVIDAFPKKGRIVSITPDAITHRFHKILLQLDLPLFRFHDLRHYSASIMHAIGIPDQYIMERGGWENDTVLKSVYRNTLNDYRKKFTEKTNEYFENMQHDMQHKK